MKSAKFGGESSLFMAFDSLRKKRRLARKKGQISFRWVVERTIAWLGRCRRLSKDVEHLVKNSAAWIYWASIQHMLRYLAPPRDQERLYLRKKAAAPVIQT